MKKMNFRIMVVALLLAAGLSSCNMTKKEKFIGLQLWSVKNDMKNDVPGTLAAVGEMGYKFVETAGYGDGKIYQQRKNGMKPWHGGIPVLQPIKRRG